MRKRARGLFERLVEFPHLLRAFRGAARRKRRSRELLAFRHELEPRLWAMRRDILAGPYPWGAYRTIILRDPKSRVIRAAPFADRVLHHAIVDLLDPIARRGFIDDTYACLPERGVHRAVARFVAFARERAGRGYLLQCDISRYFASVDHGILLGLLERKIADRPMVDLLRGLIAHGAEREGVGMPIGNLTSQLFANLYLDPLDHFVRERLRVRHYLRYMDDFVLLGPDRVAAWEYHGAIEEFLRDRLRLVLNARRTVVAPLARSHDVLGYVHRAGGGLRVRRRSVHRLWRRLGALERRHRRGEVEWSAVRASIASWVGLACHANAFTLSRALFSRRDVRHAGKRLLVQSLAKKNRLTKIFA